MQNSHVGECARCHRQITRNRAGRMPRYCTECAVEVVMEAARQMRERRGPAYEAWREACAKVGVALD